jgi:hypothetical protein
MRLTMRTRVNVELTFMTAVEPQQLLLAGVT